jgi:hypothetical protein
MQRCRDLEDETGESQIMQEGRRQCCGALYGAQGAWWAAPQTAGGMENKFEVAPTNLAEAASIDAGGWILLCNCKTDWDGRLAQHIWLDVISMSRALHV